jgi:integrase
MAEALTQKKIDALAARRPATKREVPDGGQQGLYLVVGPRTLKWLVRYRSPANGANRKLALGDYGREPPRLGLHDARKAAEGKLRAVAQGHDPIEEGGGARRHLTVVQAFEEFTERYAKVHNKATTAAETEKIIQREILPRWRARKLQTISRRDIIALVDAIAEGRGGALARPYTAVRVRALLSKAFKWFAGKSLIADNPFRDIEVPVPPRSIDRVLSDDEIPWLWKAAVGVGWPFGDLVRLLLLTGQRRDEVAKARWDEFDLSGEEPSWTIPGARTKNGRAQRLLLPRPVVAILEGLPRVQASDDKLSPFLLSTTGETPISGYSRAKRKIDEEMLKAAREGAASPEGVEIARWRLHDLRRTAASGMAALGVPVHVTEAVLNHKSGAISGVAAIYNRHDYAVEKRAALTAWCKHVDSIVGQQKSSNVVSMKRV